MGELIEHLVLKFVRNTHTVVLHLEDDFRTIPKATNHDPSWGCRVAHSVVDEIVEGPPHQIPIDNDSMKFRCGIELNVGLPETPQGVALPNRSSEEPLEFDFPALQGERTRVQTRYVEKVQHHAF